MKAKKVNRIIPLVVYPFDVMISIGQSDQELKKVLNKYGVDVSDNVWHFRSPTSNGRTVMFPGNQTLIRLRHAPKTPKQKGEFAHEVFHAVTFVMDRIGMKLIVCKSDEAYSYLTGYLTEQVYMLI